MRILLLGATGYIGSHLLYRLIADGHHVTAGVRDRARVLRGSPDVDSVVVDFCEDTEPSAWAPRLVGIDVVINAVGIIREGGRQTFDRIHDRAPCALFEAAEAARVQKVIQVSSLGACPSASSGYHHSKGRADACLQATDLNWTIFRPSILFGPDARSMTFFGALAALPVTPVIGGGGQPIQPIHIDDLVELICASLAPGDQNRQVIDAVGAEPVSQRELLALQREWLGLGRLRGLSVPPAVASSLALLASVIRSLPITRETVTMLMQGNAADVGPIVRRFGFRPRSLRDDAARCPASLADTWYARLFFVPWLLLGCISVTWIWAGVCSIWLYPRTESYQLLASIGLPGVYGAAALYGGALADIGLGLAVWARRLLGWALGMQLAMLAIYSAIITVALPELWLEPFGPVVKNLPLAGATIVLWSIKGLTPWNT